MKFKGIVKGPDSSFEINTFNYEDITRDQAKSEMRREIQRKSVPGVKAELYEIHREDADLICKWNVSEDFVVIESFLI